METKKSSRTNTLYQMLRGEIGVVDCGLCLMRCRCVCDNVLQPTCLTETSREAGGTDAGVGSHTGSSAAATLFTKS